MAFNSQEGNIYKADPQLNFLSHLALALSTTCLIESENQFVPGFMVMLPFSMRYSGFLTRGLAKEP